MKSVEFTLHFVFKTATQAHHELVSGVDDFLLATLGTPFQGQHEGFHPTNEVFPSQTFPDAEGKWNLRSIGDRTKNDSLLGIIETGGCFADGIRAATGATVGHRTLRVEDLGKVAATFTNLKTETSLRLAPKPDIGVRAPAYASQDNRRYFAQLQGYQVMPDEELFNFQWVELRIPASQIISHQNARAICSHCGEEIINERETLVNGVVLCR